MEENRLNRLTKPLIDGFIAPILALAASPVRGFLLAVGNATFAGFAFIGLCVLGMFLYWMNTTEDAYLANVAAKTKELELSNAAREAALEPRVDRTFKEIGIQATTAGVTIKWTPVPDSQGLIVVWECDGIPDVLGPYPVQKDSQGNPVLNQSISIPPTIFAGRWETGKIIAFNCFQPYPNGKARLPRTYNIRVH